MGKDKREKRRRAERRQSKEDEQIRTADNVILKDIFQKLK